LQNTYVYLENKYSFLCKAIVFSFILSVSDISIINAQDAESLSIDDSMTGETQQTEPYIKERIKDWNLKCIEPIDSIERCEANQIIFNQKQQPVAEISIFKLPKGQIAAAAATIIVPLETALNEGLVLEMQDLEPKKYQFKFCNSIGCYSQIGLTIEELEALKSKGKASIFLKHLSSGDQQIVIPISLSGFTTTFSKATQP
jgi:invasion protein IalB|tara:strand:+ start:6458 stop:7060 length:603 start_codon:yes stop_codon:yes gene_type:complete